MNMTKSTIIGSLFGVVFLGALTGCVSYVQEPRREVYVQPPRVRVEAAVVVQDDYVYYPDYQVYYSSNRHQYLYLEGRSWVTRPAPPHVSVNVLFASPAVRLGFHDHPSLHHAEIARQYPKHWAPSEASRGGHEGREEGHQRRD
jgi:hypothetical protein